MFCPFIQLLKRIAFLFVDNEVSCLSQSLKGLMVLHVLSFHSHHGSDRFVSHETTDYESGLESGSTDILFLCKMNRSPHNDFVKASAQMVSVDSGKKSMKSL